MNERHNRCYTVPFIQSTKPKELIYTVQVRYSQALSLDLGDDGTCVFILRIQLAIHLNIHKSIINHWNRIENSNIDP